MTSKSGHKKAIQLHLALSRGTLEPSNPVVRKPRPQGEAKQSVGVLADSPSQGPGLLSVLLLNMQVKKHSDDASL